MNNGYCFGLGQVYGTNSAYKQSDAQDVQIWFDQRDIGSYSQKHTLIQGSFQYGGPGFLSRAGFQLTNFNDAYELTNQVHGESALSMTEQIEPMLVNDVSVYIDASSKYVAGFQLLYHKDQNMEATKYSMPQSKVDSQGNFAPSYSYSQIEGDQFYKLDSESSNIAELSGKIVGLVSTSDDRIDGGIKSLQFIYLTESQKVCDSFMETLYIESPVAEIGQDDLTWFHWGYLAALINLLLLVIALISGCICCRKMKRSFKQLQSVRSISDLEMTEKIILNENLDGEKNEQSQDSERRSLQGNKIYYAATDLESGVDEQLTRDKPRRNPPVQTKLIDPNANQNYYLQQQVNKSRDQPDTDTIQQRSEVNSRESKRSGQNTRTAKSMLPPINSSSNDAVRQSEEFKQMMRYSVDNKSKNRNVFTEQSLENEHVNDQENSQAFEPLSQNNKEQIL